MSREDCERLRDLQNRTDRSYLEHIGNDPQEGQNANTPNGSEPGPREVYEAAAAEYKGHVATEHPLMPVL